MGTEIPFGFAILVAGVVALVFGLSAEQGHLAQVLESDAIPIAVQAGVAAIIAGAVLAIFGDRG